MNIEMDTRVVSLSCCAMQNNQNRFGIGQDDVGARIRSMQTRYFGKEFPNYARDKRKFCSLSSANRSLGVRDNFFPPEHSNQKSFLTVCSLSQPTS